jgi:lipopolysaccharide transport system ATP-binding protein
MSSNPPAIRVSHLSKQYKLGGPQEPYHTFRDAIVNSLKAPMNVFRRAPPVEGFWALKDVSFEVEQGEVVGIIGRNGAGKSTLLKILSRITSPTEGTVELHGRVGSLLEVGTGFHPELTGRENIYLSGTILGMKRWEIDAKLDEIVKFSEIEKFLDTPVKRYSSGMYVRLGFAVAAHLEPEILIIDEVLAVGDAAFQKKCLGKMGDVAKEGRTVLYVSHNMSTIMTLCSRVILLQEGGIKTEGTPDKVIQQYLINTKQGSVVWDTLKDAPGNHIVKLHSVKVIQQGNDQETSDVLISKDIHIELQYWNLSENSKLYAAIWLKTSSGIFVFSSSNHKYISLTEDIWSQKPHPRGLFKSIITIPGNFLNSGLYNVTAIIGTGISNTQILEENIVSFEVYDDGEMTKEYFGSWTGPVVRPKLAWETQIVSNNDPKKMER